MKSLDHQKLDAVNQSRSNLFGWRGQFTPEFKLLEFERFSNCGGFATIKSGRSVVGFNSLEFEGIRNQPN